MASPHFKVKALYEYTSEHDDDLHFNVGQIITVTEQEDDDWYVGEYEDASGTLQTGLFPKNFVEKYEPVAPPRPTRSMRPKKEAEHVEASATEPPAPPPAPEQHAEPEEEHDDTPLQEPAAPPQQPEVTPESTSAPAPQSAPMPAQVVVPSPVPVPAKAVGGQAHPPPAPKPASPKASPPPPVSQKPSNSAFRDRIAAFNKVAPPVTPFKPGGLGSTSSGFIKKPFVAPPPSKNAYVPIPREAPPQRIYKREEDPEIAAKEAENQENAEKAGLAPTSNGEEAEEQPKPTSLKERIALLQKQQMEQAARHAEALQKKEKPKRPPKKRLESHETGEGAEAAEGAPGEGHAHEEAAAEPAKDHSTNDTDTPAVVETEGQESTKPESDEAQNDTQEGNEADEEDEDEDEEEDDIDPEVRRREELRARMAKMSGGMGMHGMFGVPVAAPPPLPKKKKSVPPAEKPSEDGSEDASFRPPPIAMIPLPGLSRVRSSEEPKAEDSERPTTPAAPAAPAVPPIPPAPVPVEAVHDAGQEAATKEEEEHSPPVPTHEENAPPPIPGGRPAPPPVPKDGKFALRPPAPPPPPQPMSPSAGSESDDELSEQTQSLSIATPTVPPPVPTTAPRPPPPAPPGVPGSPLSPVQRRNSYFSQDGGPSTPTSPSAKRVSRVPPIPPSVSSPKTRAPPPPPPGPSLSRTSTGDARDATARMQTSLLENEEEVTEYEGDYDTDIASAAPHKDALKGSTEDHSSDANSINMPYSHAPPPPPPAAAPRAPPPLPSQPPRMSADIPRAAPPPPPPPPAKESSYDDDEYDPFKYNSSEPSVPAAAPTAEVNEDEDIYSSSPRRSHPPPPPPPGPPARASTMPISPDESGRPTSILGAPPRREPMPPPSAAPIRPIGRQSSDLHRANTPKRSIDLGRMSMDTGYVAHDVDLSPGTNWWTVPNGMPTVFQNRKDILYEFDESTSTKRGGKTLVTKDLYILFQDYSQTVITAIYDAHNPADIKLEQRHEPPPTKLRQDQLEDTHARFGKPFLEAVVSKKDNVVGDGTPHNLVKELLKPFTDALRPVGTRSYGALIYSNMANASTSQNDEIRPGDIISFRNAKFQGKHGAMHAKYSMEVGKPEHVAIVAEWDGTKKKVRAWEQGREGKKVKLESFKLDDLRSGEVKIWRIVPRSWVGWEGSN
ncbi:hypothetical protein F5884DRAFT_858495 [Xylogone sp. PMI_703]|nr:hypothetical protein F5884DRAFT_858495 [Xylogone sp. PMI_703]